MMMTMPQDITELLVNWSQGDRASLDHLTELLYDELRRLAAAHLRRGGVELETIQPTALAMTAGSTYK